MKKKTTATPSKENKRQAWLTEQRLRFYPLLLGLLALSAVFFVMVGYESDFLFRVQELNLFLYTPLYLQQQMVVAGGLLTYAGTYFTQFFYHPWMGSLLLCLWLGLLMWLTARTFRVPGRWAVLLLVPVVLVLLTDFTLGYWIYVLKLRGQFFIAVMGCSAVVALLWAFRSLGSRWKSIPALLLLVLTPIALYPLIGFYALLATVLMGLMAWGVGRWSLARRVAASVTALLMTVVVPLVYYRHVFYQTKSEDIWWQGLPLFAINESYPVYYVPYVLLGVFLVAMTVMSWRTEAPQSSKEAPQRSIEAPRRWLAMQVLVLGLMVWGCQHFWYRNANFSRELQMENMMEQLDWQGALRVYQQSNDEPTRTMWMLKNVAVFRLGRAGDEMYNYRNGNSKPDCPFVLPMVVQCGKMVYMNSGLPNFAYRWCVEDGVEYGWRATHLKYLVRCSLLNGEWTLAQKFIDLLKQTRYHADWAAHYERLVGQPDKLKSDPELGMLLHLNTAQSRLASDQSVLESFLISMLSMQNTDDPVMADLVCMAALQQKDIPTFWRAFFQYAELHPGQPMPRHYQEAAFMFGQLEHTVDISHMPFDPGIPQSFQQFMEAAQQLAGKTTEQQAEAMRLQYGHTYYYDYFLMRNLTTY